MSVTCEIRVRNPPGGVFNPGSIVHAEVKYTALREEVFNNIAVSLKGKGCAYFTRGKRRHIEKEIYVLNNVVLMNNPRGFILPLGTHEQQFNFKIPKTAPPTIDCCNKQTNRYYMKRCNIYYYVSIEFGRPGLFNTPKRFKKSIIVGPHITPRLPTTPKTYSTEKYLTQIFTLRTSVVHLKVTVENSVISPCKKIRFNYEVLNDTNLRINGISTKLMEIYTFLAKGGYEATLSGLVSNTSSRTGFLESGYFRTESVEINIPCNRFSIEGSCMIAREYAIEVTVQLPLPHRDLVMMIPIQIGDRVTIDSQIPVQVVNNEQTDMDSIPSYDAASRTEVPPPSYWEVMGEEKRPDESDDDL